MSEQGRPNKSDRTVVAAALRCSGVGVVEVGTTTMAQLVIKQPTYMVPSSMTK